MGPPSEILKEVGHRPWPLPSGPWIMMQSWHDLLFAHWRMAPEQLRPLLPKSLTLDTFEGDAWIVITPFHMHLRPRGLPSVSHFPELNCRTYVEFGGKPGVLFFSLDAGSRLAVWGAKTFYLLPYFHAHIKIRKEGDRIRYISRRSSAAASLSANYAPSGPVRDSRRGTLEHWLTERYCLYAYSRQRLYRGKSIMFLGPCRTRPAKLRRTVSRLRAELRYPKLR